MTGPTFRRLAVIVLSIALAFVAMNAFAQTLHYSLAARQLVEDRLKKYGGNDTQREVSLKQLFADAGCDNEHLSEQPVKGSKLPNVICVLPGTSDQTIVVGAHFDHVAAGDGVVDNWSGAALLPSLYEAVKGVPRRHTYIFIGFTDEERGEVGSRFYVKRLTPEEVAAIKAMVCLDTLGLGMTNVWAHRSDKQLTDVLAYTAQTLHIPLQAVNVDEVGSTDSQQFVARKIPSITIHTLTQQTWNEHILHGLKDRISAVRMDDYYQTYHLVSVYLVLLDLVPRPEGTRKPH
jgi:putative aminopeptidase FrvX